MASEVPKSFRLRANRQVRDTSGKVHLRDAEFTETDLGQVVFWVRMNAVTPLSPVPGFERLTPSAKPASTKKGTKAGKQTRSMEADSIAAKLGFGTSKPDEDLTGQNDSSPDVGNDDKEDGGDA